MIEKLKNERDAGEKKYKKMSNDTASYQERSRKIISQNQLENYQMRRKHESRIIPDYGYYKDNRFVFGPYLKELQEEIEKKIAEI